MSTRVTPAHLIGVVGVPGDGKSFMARSAYDLGETAVALTDPKEASFYAGRPNVTLFHDFDWRPHADVYNATAFGDLLRWCDARTKDTSKFVVLDTGSEASDLAMHDQLKVHATASPSDVSNGKAWIGHDQSMKALLIELRRIQAAGKTVIVTFHGQMKEMEGAGDAKKALAFASSKNNPVMEWRFDEQLLPALMTSFRQRIHSAFDIWLYTKPTGFGPARKYYVTALADSVRPAKHSVNFKSGANLAMIPNTMKALLDLLETPAAPAAPAAAK